MHLVCIKKRAVSRDEYISNIGGILMEDIEFCEHIEINFANFSFITECFRVGRNLDDYSNFYSF